MTQKEQGIPVEAGEALDALVAEHVMGWTDVGEHVDCADPSCPGFQHSEFVPFGNFGGKRDYVRRYSTDISAAWEVVEKMQGRGHELVLSDVAHRGQRPWSALFTGGKGRKAGQGKAPTAPHAICLSALHAVRFVAEPSVGEPVR